MSGGTMDYTCPSDMAVMDMGMCDMMNDAGCDESMDERREYGTLSVSSSKGGRAKKREEGGEALAFASFSTIQLAELLHSYILQYVARLN